MVTVAQAPAWQYPLAADRVVLLGLKVERQFLIRTIKFQGVLTDKHL